MTKYYYKKSSQKRKKAIFRLLGLFIFLAGILILLYVSLPLISWQIYFAPIFASQEIAVPIPKTTVVSEETIKSLVSTAANNITGVDYTNAQNWFPTYKAPAEGEAGTPRVSSYTLSIPKLKIENATVSTVGYELDKYLVNYPGTAIPSNNGNAVVYGHSTLPQLFNPKDYKTIFATAYKLTVNDEVFATVENVTYRYKIFSVTVVDPSDTSVFSQTYDNSYITLVTCTPPGTTWKRLIIKARLQKI